MTQSCIEIKEGQLNSRMMMAGEIQPKLSAEGERDTETLRQKYRRRTNLWRVLATQGTNGVTRRRRAFSQVKGQGQEAGVCAASCPSFCSEG